MTYLRGTVCLVEAGYICLTCAGSQHVSDAISQEEWRQVIAEAYTCSAEQARAAMEAVKAIPEPIAMKAKGAGAATPGATSTPRVAARVASVAVESMCSALGVPLPQKVARSGLAMTMVKHWGEQFAGAYGRSELGAGICKIGAEVSEPRHRKESGLYEMRVLFIHLSEMDLCFFHGGGSALPETIDFLHFLSAESEPVNG